MVKGDGHSQRQLYRLAPVDKTGVFLGLSFAQLLVSGAGAVTGSVVMVARSVPVGLAITVVAGGFGLARLNGEPVLMQLPHLVRRLTSRSGSAHLVPIPIVGPPPGKRRVPPLWEQSILPVDPSTYGIDLKGTVAVVRDDAAGLYSVSLRVAGRQFGLLEPEEQDYQLAGWGNVLQGFVAERPIISSVRWCEWAAPSGIEEQRDWLEAHKSAQPIPDALAAYERLLADAGPIATRHEVLLTITTSPSRVPRHGTGSHGRREDTVIAALLNETRLVRDRLQAAGLTAKVLDPTELARAVRLRLDPTVRGVLDRKARHTGTSISPSNVMPLSTDTRWTYYRADGSFHRAFWVTEWPRIDVPGDWLRPLLLHSTSVRTIGVFFEPVPRSKSQRHITAQATKIEADVAHRNTKGFRVGAWHRRAEQAVREREEELVAGFSELMFSAVISVTAPSLEELDRVSADITQVAAAVGIEIRPLHGRHDQAVLSVLPTARATITSTRP